MNETIPAANMDEEKTPKSAVEAPKKETITFSEEEALPSMHWGKRIERETERSIGNLGLRLDVATLDAKAAKESAHKYEMRSERFKSKYDRLEAARDGRDNKIEALKDPGKLLNRYAVTSWINESRVSVLQTRNRFTNWRLGRTQNKLIDTNADWKAAENTFTLADKRRLDFAERIDKRVESRLNPVRERLESVDARLGTLQTSIKSVEEVADRVRERLERLKSLRGRASSETEMSQIKALMKPDEDALRLANETLQRDLFPRLAKAQKHYERTSRAYIFATAAQEKIAARYELHSHGTPEARADERTHSLPDSSSGSRTLDTGNFSGSPASIDLKTLLAELFKKPEPTAKSVVEAWNKLYGYTSPLKDVDQLWEFAIEAGFEKDKVSTMTAADKSEFKASAEDWQATMRALVEKSPRFRDMVQKAMPRGKSEREFVDAFINSIHYAI